MLISLKEASNQIASGKVLLLAGDQALLSQLPKGNWIGGSIPYFIAEAGGVFSQDKIFVQELDGGLFLQPVATAYTAQSISRIAEDCPEDGATFLILPFGSAVHFEYSKKAPDYAQMFQSPIVGWVSGMALGDIGKVPATVMNGFTGEVYQDRAIALRCRLKAGKSAQIGIVNIFSPGLGDSLEFLGDSFDVSEVVVNGKKQNFYDYLVKNSIDTKLPLVGDFSGARINVSIMSLDAEKKIVHLYAPVFPETVYRVATPIANYAKAFEQALKTLGGKSMVFSCNCILNYLYGELEGKKTGSLTGPITFGEIAYQLVNQTFVYLEVV